MAPAAAVHGLQEAGYIDSDAALELPSLPKSLIVLGGGYIGCELGQFFARMGVKTSMVLRSRHLLSGEDHDIGEALTEYFREEGIDVHTQTQIMRVSVQNGKKTLHVLRNGVEGDLQADELLYCPRPHTKSRRSGYREGRCGVSHHHRHRDRWYDANL